MYDIVLYVDVISYEFDLGWISHILLLLFSCRYEPCLPSEVTSCTEANHLQMTKIPTSKRSSPIGPTLFENELVKNNLSHSHLGV